MPFFITLYVSHLIHKYIVIKASNIDLKRRFTNYRYKLVLALYLWDLGLKYFCALYKVM